MTLPKPDTQLTHGFINGNHWPYNITFMKAIVYTKYGPPDVLKLEEVQKPTSGDNEVLVKVHAASVNPLDWHALRGTPFMHRLSGAGLLKPKNKILGADVAGQVEAAAVPQGAITVLHCLRDKGQVQPGQKVLVNGASGGVGVFAVQIAKYYGAEVTGVCSTRNLDLVRSIGADQVIDYTKEDFTRNGQHYDLIIDNVGNRSVSDYKRALSPNGIFVLVGFSMSLLLHFTFLGPWISMTGSRKMSALIPKENREDLVLIKELLETGKVVPVIDRSYPLSEVAEAIRYLEEGHAQGKVVITL